MKTNFISAILFLCVLGFIFFADSKLQRLYNNISSESKTIENLIDDDNWEEAYYKTVTLLEDIDKESLISSVYVNHTEFDNLTNEAIKLCLFIQCRDISQSHVSANLLKSSAEAIRNLNELNLKNVL